MSIKNPYAIIPTPHQRIDKTFQENLWEDQVEREIFKLSNFFIPGPFTNDAAAAAAGIQKGGAYYQASGALVVRLV